MADFLSQQIPPPKGWQEFEDLCADLWREIWNDPDAHKNGRQGQPQHGVDVYGTDVSAGVWCGVQCKGKDGRYRAEVTEKELKEEVEKAKLFDPKISRFVVATSAPVDQKIQAVARNISEAHQKLELFSVSVIGWDEIQRRIGDFPELVDKYFPNQGPVLSSIQRDVTDLKEWSEEERAAVARREQQIGVMASQVPQPSIGRL